MPPWRQCSRSGLFAGFARIAGSRLCANLPPAPGAIRYRVGGKVDPSFKGMGAPLAAGRATRVARVFTEWMRINSRLRALVSRETSAQEIRQCAVGHGMQTLRAAGFEALQAGITTSSELNTHL